jgi:sialic acid synthase SpsE/protoporphyrinogen oxidase
MRVYVLGAGMSGLATAEKLLELGITDVTIIEQGAEAGGLARSFEWGGFANNDLGPHIWHTPNQSLAQEWAERFGDLLVKGQFWGKNVVGEAPGKYIDYPLSYETLKNFDTETQTKIKNELASCSKESQIRAKNFEEYVLALVGPTLTSMFFKAYPEKLWGVSTSEMTANWAPKRINFTQSTQEFHGDQWAGVGRYGSGAIIEFITENIKKLGGTFQFNSYVSGLDVQGNLISGIELNNANKIKLSPEDRVVSTLPFNYFSELLGVSNTLTYRGALLIYVSVNKSQVIPGEAAFLYFAQPDVPFHRLSEQKKFSNFGWPIDQTTIVVEIAFNEDESEKLDLASLTKQTLDGLIKYGLLEKEDVLDTMCVKLPTVYPLMTASKEIEFKSIYSSLQDFNQVYFIGTGGEYHYADLQILYTKGRDLAVRIVEEEERRLPTRDNEGKIQNSASFFPPEPFVIAEIGLNHGGSLELAKELLREAKNSGVKFVKFQTYKSELRISQVYRSNNYFEEVVDTEENLFSMFKKYELSQSDWSEIFKYGRELELNVFSAVFDDESLRLLENLNCPAYKIASMDVNNYPLIEKIAQTRKPIILSTGMSTLGEIEKAVSIIEKYSPVEFIILHCISSYPANKDSLNLNAMLTLANAFGRPVGFSDHSIGTEVPIVAVSIGAVCVEKHFTLDHSLEGPDHIFSLNPKEMSYLVNIISEIPGMLGSSNRITTAQEVETSYKFKKSIHARKNILKGHRLTEADLIIKGPYGGIAPDFYGNVIGRSVKENINEDYPITWNHL